MKWDDITINDYIQIKQIMDLGDNVGNLKEIELLKILTHKDVEQMPFVEVLNMLGGMDFLGENIEPKHPKETYTIDGVRYELHADIVNITTAQYCDYVNYLRDVPEGEIYTKYGEILSVFLIPKGHKYGEGYSVKETIHAIENHLPITDTVDIAFFLQCYFKVYTNILNGCLMEKAAKAQQ